MSDEPESMILRFLQEIRHDIAAMKNDIVTIKETQMLHSLRLQNQSGMFGEVTNILRELADRARREEAANVPQQLRALEERVSALEGRRQ
jgi:hypothetical protein